VRVALSRPLPLPLPTHKTGARTQNPDSLGFGFARVTLSDLSSDKTLTSDYDQKDQSSSIQVLDNNK
jgi:hypothetical protein